MQVKKKKIKSYLCFDFISFKNDFEDAVVVVEGGELYNRIITINNSDAIFRMNHNE